MAGGMDHTEHMALMMQDMEVMMQRMVEMHASMAVTHTMPMTGTMAMPGMAHEQHMGRMMIMMGQMMQLMGEMHMKGGMGPGAMSGGMSGMCDMMGGEGCEMMGGMSGMSGMDHGAMGGGMSGMDHGAMGGGMSGMCDMMGGQGCEMMGGMGAGSPVTGTQSVTAGAVGTPDTRTSEAGGRAVTVTPLNLTDPQATTLDFALSWQDQATDAGLDVAALATLRAGTTQLAASGWQPDSGVLSFPATNLSGVNTVTLVLRTVAGAPLRTFTWALRP